MYLWKCWRDVRGFFFVGIAYLVILLVLAIRHHSVDANNISLLWVLWGFTIVHAALLCVLAWGMGSLGVGGEIGKGVGAYLLTRPRQRKLFLWQEWLISMALLSTLLILAVCIFLAEIRLHYFGFGYQTTAMPASDVFHLKYIMLAGICGLLLVALVYSMTYFFTMITRSSSRGLIFAIGTITAYLFMKMEINEYAPHLSSHIPDLVLVPFIGHASATTLHEGLFVSILLRLTVILLFPLAAQFVLERAEV